MKIAFIASYVPRKCGIATYTRDLAEEMIRQGHEVKIIAMENEALHIEYGNTVVAKIRQNQLEDYKKAAETINASDIDVVHIQHEFGLFGGNDGEYILTFANLLQKPFLVTFHTILFLPRPNQKFIMQEMARLSRGIVVMEPIAKDRLINVYDITPYAIHIIYHGVPTIDGIGKNEAKKQLGLEKKFVIIANNLIANNKGYEYVIRALPEVIKKIPHILFIIIGETHPLVKLGEGEKYREELIRLANEVKVKEYMQFINRYISLNELRMYLSATDIYVTPYLDPEQITSGTLSYALGVGKACISTPYIYAKNILTGNRGVLVPFRDSNAIEKAIVELYENPVKKKLIERNAKMLGRKMRWDKVAHKHNQLYTKIIHNAQKISKLARKIISKKLNITHLEFLTDNMGLLQHTHYAIPERRFGYSTDDNARAFIVIAALYHKNKSVKLFQFMKLYISFLHLAQESNGKFHTFLNFQHNWIDTEGTADPYGKAVWSLGYFLYICAETVFSQSVDMMFRKSLERIDSITDLRTAAYSILGLYYYYKRFEGEKEMADTSLQKIIKLADFMCQNFEKNSDVAWQWFETIITYDNFRIPQALFAAYQLTKKEKYKTIAVNSLEFILSCSFNSENNYFDFVGQDGWYEKHKEKAVYDQQPLEAAAAVDSLLFAHKVTKQKKYIDLAFIAFEWFLGRNRNKLSLLDARTGGVYDGLTPHGINQNEGAESLVCFLIAQQSLKEVLK